MLEIKLSKDDDTTKIIVVDVGGAGNNAMNRMIGENIEGVELIDISTDKQALQFCKASTVMQIGEKLACGLGAGVKPEVGGKVAEESTEDLTEMLENADTVSVTYSMGGGTDTGAAPVIARIAKELGILIIGVMMKPPNFEGRQHINNTLVSAEHLKETVDMLIVIPNNKSPEIMDCRTSMPEASSKVDEILKQVVQGITDLVNIPGLINLDFVGVQTVMTDRGIAHIGIGKTHGNDRALEAVETACVLSLFKTMTDGASNIITNISDDINLIEANRAASYVQETAGDDANIIFSAMYDENVQDEHLITVTATGPDQTASRSAQQRMVTMGSYRRNVTQQQTTGTVKQSAQIHVSQQPIAVQPEVQPRQMAGHNGAMDPLFQQQTQPQYQRQIQPQYRQQAQSQYQQVTQLQQGAYSFESCQNKNMSVNTPDFLKSRK